MASTGRDAEALLVAKLDRLTRSVRDLSVLFDRYFQHSNWALLSVSESIDTRSAAGRLVLNVLTCVAQWEREVGSHVSPPGCGSWVLAQQDTAEGGYGSRGTFSRLVMPVQHMISRSSIRVGAPWRTPSSSILRNTQELGDRG